VAVQCQIRSQRAYPTTGSAVISPPENFAKLKQFWHTSHDFQPISFTHRLDLNKKASSTFLKT